IKRKVDCLENATMSLKHLTKKLLKWDIQIGKSGHSSVEDAQVTMKLYELAEVGWEQPAPESPKRLVAMGTLVMWQGRSSTAPRRNRAFDQWTALPAPPLCKLKL
ncbi:interferon-stimulated 20 kda, partial [Lynx pardinus]